MLNSFELFRSLYYIASKKKYIKASKNSLVLYFVAETSLTIPSIKYAIDTGFMQWILIMWVPEALHFDLNGHS